MRYNFFQKTLSFFLIFALLFSVTFRLPLDIFLASSVFARDSEFNNLVSILIEEDLYGLWDIRSRVERYARDIQWVLENTRAVIIPVPNDASVYNIASLNEKLFQEWYVGLDSSTRFESRLIGTVLIWELPIPFVFDWDDVSKTILPYVDFVDKTFVYNHESNRYVRRDTSGTNLQPDIWHWVIQPNTWTRDWNLQALKDYFDKNNDFYRWRWVFSSERNIASWRNNDVGENYKPFVFYYDQFRENSWLQLDRYTWYEMYLDNIEDLTYNRYTRELAERVSERVLWIQNNELIDLVLNVDPEFDVSRFQNKAWDISWAPEITTRYITDNVVKSFVEIFNGATLSEMRKNVYNAWRYNEWWSQVNIDMPPFLISTLDEITSGIIKNVNTSLELQITELVANGLSREIPIQHNTQIVWWDGLNCWTTYTNFYYGLAGQNLQSARDCTIFRWSTDWGTLVEANRWYNVLHVPEDVNLCWIWMDYDENTWRITEWLTWFWWGNSPVNLIHSPEWLWGFELWTRNIQRATRPLFDILGSKEINNSNRIPSPLNCFNDWVNLLTYKEEFYSYTSWDDTITGCRLERNIPIIWDSVTYYTRFSSAPSFWWIENRPSWTNSVSRYCAATNPILWTSSSFDVLYNQSWWGWGFGIYWSCLIQDLRLEGTSLKQQRQARVCSSDWDWWTTCEPCPPTTTYNFHSIPSYILHTSPTDEEFALISRNMATPSLPVDKNRYIDFIAARWGAAPNYGYRRIDFPQLFRVLADDTSELNLEALAEKTKNHLDEVSAQINQVIRNSDPSSLSWTQRELYELLETWDFPEANIDLYASLKNRPLETLSIWWQSKQISYFDTLVFAIYWRNLWTPSSKYKFIFENYLTNQFEGEELLPFVLPRHKNSYEIGYFAAPWDAENMYVKLDPDQKMIHPYAEIIAANMSLRGTVSGMSVSDFEFDEGTFKCWPPDGVMIWEWIPAIICWLQDMLPPKIKIWETSCSLWDTFLSQEEREELEACQWDANKNWINDCLEAKLVWWSLVLKSDWDRYYYNSLGTLRSELYDNLWDKATFDSISYINFYLDYLDIPVDSNKDFDDSNIQRIYKRWDNELWTDVALQNALRYINFTDTRMRVMWGEASTYFSTKGYDINAWFQTTIIAKDLSGENVIDLTSNLQEIRVRWDRLFMNIYSLDEDNILGSRTGVPASDISNIYLTDKTDSIPEITSWLNDNQEKIILWMLNNSQSWQRLQINYPIEITIRNQGSWDMYLQETLTQNQIGDLYPLAAIRESWRYEIQLRDNAGFFTKRVIDIFPRVANRLEVDMSTTLIETWNNITTHVAHFYDVYDNIASWKQYSLEMRIDWNGIVFENNNSKELTLQVIDWFRPFRLKSTELAWQNQIQFTLRDLSWNIISQVSRNVQVLDKINATITALDATPVVWGDVFRYRVRFTDNTGNILTQLSSRASLSLPSLYGRPEYPYVAFQNGEVILWFQTRELAGRNVQLNIQLEWWNHQYPLLIDIHPEAPIKIDLNLSRNKIEASSEDSSILEAVLKDRYDNVVFTDSSTEISVELHERSEMIASISQPSKVSRNWKAQFQIFWSEIPGTAYFRVDTSPSLSQNSFKLHGQAPFSKDRLIIPGMKNSQTGELTNVWNLFFRDFSENYFITRFTTLSRLEESEVFWRLPSVLQNQVRDFWNETNFLEVHGIWENAGMIETFYFWNKDKIHANAYNTLHTTLFWSHYGDVTQENYLAWWLLFDRDNAAISVTSLLNNPFEYSDMFRLSENASLSALQSNDITQDIQFWLQVEPSWIIRTDIVNEALNTFIGRIYLLTKNPEYMWFNILDDAYVVQTWVNDITTFTWPAWNRLLRFSKQDWFELFWSVQLDFDRNFTWDWFRIILRDERAVFWDIIINGEFDIDISRDTNVVAQKKSQLQDTLLVELISNQYSSRRVTNWEEDFIMFHYHDPFSVRDRLDSFHNFDNIWGEIISRQEWIAWKDQNKMMLSLAAWETIWEATKNNMSFSLINLWDPVFALPVFRQNFIWTDTQKSFDSTIWRLVSQEEGLLRFEVLDYNNNWKLDVLTVHRNGYLRLYERSEIDNDFIFQRSLVYAADWWSARLVKTWDFIGDWYSDIFFVDDAWRPQLFNNHQKKFQRIDLSDQLSLSWSIIQAEVFDMDNDGIDDIVTLDSTWQIHIWYGNPWDSQRPLFTKLFVWDGYSVRLSDTPISHGWLVYFDGMTEAQIQNPQNILQLSQNYLEEVQRGIEAGQSSPMPIQSNMSDEYREEMQNTLDTRFLSSSEMMNEELIDTFLYVPLPYRPTTYMSEWDARTQLLDEFSSWISTTSLWEFWENTQDAVVELDAFTSEWERYIQYSNIERSQSQNTFFLRSEYAYIEWIEVKKTFTDANPPHLQTGDTVYLDISLTNTSNIRKDNIAYADMLPKFFNFKNDQMIILTEDERIMKRSSWVWSYHILIDRFYLDPWEETIIRIELEALPLQYGHMEVGIFEQWEPWFDEYWDIIIKESDKNCWQTADIFRSVAARLYVKWTTEPKCDADVLDVWNTFPWLQDSNNSGIPDNLEEILNLSSNSELQAYSQNALQEFIELTVPAQYQFEGDTFSGGDDSALDMMGMVDMVNGMVDEILWELDQLIQWLSCGFWGWSCISMPLNWAPLAPGSTPTLFWMPVWPLTPSTWIPVFSSLTWRQTTCWKWKPCCLPSAYPSNSTAYVPGPFCWAPSAGWKIWTWSPTNKVRLYVTPTLTWAVGIAACFWWPAIVAWNANPMWVHPLVPGWNCVVAAMPLIWCQGDEWDPSVVGYPIVSNWVWLIHANCPVLGREWAVTPRQLLTEFVEDYLEYQSTWNRPESLYNNYERALREVSDMWAQSFQFPNEPLINIGSWQEWMMSLWVDLDLWALSSGWFQDVIQINNKRTPGFPWFLMNWVERQLDEVTSKLTNLPKIFVILPEFWGIFDYSFRDFGSWFQESFQTWAQSNDERRAQDQSRIQSLRNQRSALDCSWADRLRCTQLNTQIAVANAQSQAWWAQETLSWIKQVYEFIWKIPLVNIEPQTVSISVPWIDPSEFNRFSADWSYALKQMESEVERAKNSWSFGAACNESTPEAQAACQRNNDIRRNASLQADEFLHSVRHNIDTLESYAEIPQKIAKLINIKEIWLEQILCNIEAIAELMGRWINDNGQRFKAWVEVFLLVKAALKSWQWLIDVFIEYEESCHECKNERHDLQNFIWRLISAVIPSPPIIEFPKWPDIILDFHHIRAWMTIQIPDFDINWTPLVLPNLPNLVLPDTPSVDFSLPPLPLLPSLDIPDLPDLPNLPTIELPDLPPPPKIPKLFGAVQVVLNIWKLVTKVMCIIKGSPFVPEWRAGDQIAFITERNGYIPWIDFIDFQPPAFSYSAISAIKVTTYVNFEFEFDFIVEMARAIVEPINWFTNNIANLFDIQISNIDLSEVVPSEINIDLNTDGTIDTDLGWNRDSQEEYISLFVWAFANYFARFVNYLVDNQSELYTSDEFKLYLTEQLASKTFSEDQSTRKIQDIWTQVFNFNFSKEDRLIEELAVYNRSKFQTLENIIQSEIDYSRQQRETLENMSTIDFYIQTSLNPDVYRFENYNSQMESFNIETLEAITQFVSWPTEEQIEFEQSLERDRQDIMDTARWWLSRHMSYNSSSHDFNLVAAVSWGTTQNTNVLAQNSCDISWDYKYDYKWIYILEDERNYRLFDYIDLLRWNEQTFLWDVDNDGDVDVLYLMDGALYFKENYKNQRTKTFVSEAPLTIPVSRNPFFKANDIYYESINGFQEAVVSNGAINVSFERPTNPLLKNFRMTYHTKIDKYLALDTESYFPQSSQTHIVDALADINSQTLRELHDTYSIYDHEATFSHIWNIWDLKLTTQKLKNIRDSILENTQVTLTPRTRLYTWNQSAEITYLIWNTEEKLRIPPRSSVAFRQSIIIQSISWDAYVKLWIREDLLGSDVTRYIWLPVFPDTVLSFTWNKATLTPSANAQIRYYDNSRFDIDFRKISSYTMYDLWSHSWDIYRIRLDADNDFYYARILAFRNNIESTLSEQILLAPQVAADRYPPEIWFTQKIRIPVYQKDIVDFTPYIYEDSWIQGIDIVRIDFDINSEIILEDGSDRDEVTILQTPARIAAEFWPFDELMDTYIRMTLTDGNWNVSSRNIPFEIYAPVPKIDSIDDTTITWRISERLIDEPIRLYRFRWSDIERLEDIEWNDIAYSFSWGLFDFEATDQANWLIISYGETSIASIDEFSWVVTPLVVWVTTSVLASNDSWNTSVFPQLIINYLGTPIYRQNIVMPQSSVQLLAPNQIMDDVWVYVQVIEQEAFSSYRIPLSAPYNPWAVSVYRSGSDEKIAAMTILQDWRIIIDQNRYMLEYWEYQNLVALTLKQRWTNLEVAKVIYKLDWSFIIR